MRSIIVACILLSGGLITRAQLNYEGNPLTDTIDYTAQESQSSRLNAQQYYQRFEFADGRKINFSKLPFKPSAIDPLATQETKHQLSGRDDSTAYGEQANKAIKQTPSAILVDNSSSSLNKANYSDLTRSRYASGSEEARNDKEPAIEASSEASITKPKTESRVENRQLREYPIQSAQAGTQPPIARYQSPQNPTGQTSNVALSQFLNSRTPEESQIALQKYLTSRDGNSPVSIQRSVGIDQNGIVRDTSDNEISTNYDNQNYLRRNNNLETPFPAIGSPDSSGQVAYLSPGQYQQLLRQHPSSRWNQMAIQSRRDGFYVGPSMKHPVYHGPMRPRVSPWAQSRIAPGPPIYHQKGSIHAGPPPASGNNGHWKPPVEVIYTKPPNSLGQTVNSPVPYNDAGKWFPEADHPPPKKDIYYSQLYAQSYDPHYYNYIAKTGKIKPWLYGKLGKTEEPSIWSELFTGFKNNGMKNMMNPMFLLGMSIPTLTLMLSALIQKRSLARSDDGFYDPRQLIEQYQPQILTAILNYENQLKEITGHDTSNGRKIRKRSVESPARDFHPVAPSAYPFEHRDTEKETKNKESSIGPAPPGVSPFEEFFLNHQAAFALAILAEEKKYKDRNTRKIYDVFGQKKTTEDKDK